MLGYLFHARKLNYPIALDETKQVIHMPEAEAMTDLKHSPTPGSSAP